MGRIKGAKPALAFWAKTERIDSPGPNCLLQFLPHRSLAFLFRSRQPMRH